VNYDNHLLRLARDNRSEDMTERLRLRLGELKSQQQPFPYFIVGGALALVPVAFYFEGSFGAVAPLILAVVCVFASFMDERRRSRSIVLLELEVRSRQLSQ
jgi:hypothetical protein